jgi:hypothetical protein
MSTGKAGLVHKYADDNILKEGTELIHAHTHTHTHVVQVVHQI